MNVLRSEMGNSLGTGLAQSAADIKRLRAQWQQEVMDGTTNLQFKEWVKDKGGNITAMPREDE